MLKKLCEASFPVGCSNFSTEGLLLTFSNKRKILIACWFLLAFALLSTNCLLWVAYTSFQKLVVNESQSRLVALATLAAQNVSQDVEVLTALVEEGSSAQALSALQKNIADSLVTFSKSHKLAGAILLDIDNKIVASTNEFDNVGEKPAWIVLYNEQILAAWQGVAEAAPPLSQDDFIVQCAFSPVVDNNGVAQAVLWAEADSDFLRREKKYIRNLFGSIGITSILILLIAYLLFRRIVLSYLEAADAIARSERLSAIGRLAAGVSHEIRNPLSIMTTTCQYLRGELEDKECDNKQQVQLIDDVLGEIDRLNGIVTRFLALARQPSDQAQSSADLKPIVRDVIAMVERNFLKRGLDITTELEEEIPRVQMCAEHVRQILLNLILNSADAICDKGHVEVLLRSIDGAAEITVADDGKGFPKQILDHPFEPFQTTKETGTGLGLSMVKNLVDSVKGEVSVYNRKEQGAKVVVSIPLAKEDV